MFKKILLTVDLEHEASWRKAMPVAGQAAHDWGAELHILTVVPEIGSPLVLQDLPVDFVKETLAAATARLETLIAERGGEIPWPLIVRSHVRYGRVHDEIIAAITEIGADLVVMASHAPDRMREFLIGSQADRVARRSTASVLVVRD